MRLNRKQIFKKLETLVNNNCSKYLSGDSIRHKTFIYMRDQEEQTSYYLLTAKGNYLRAYRINYVDNDGQWVNTFLSISIPSIIGAKPTETVRKKELIAKEKFNAFEKFAAEFRAQSESLEWFDR